MTKKSKSQAGHLGQIASQPTHLSQYQQRIETYSSNPARCLECQNSLEYQKRSHKFCSKSCAATYNNTKFPKRKKPASKSCKYCADPIASHKNFCGLTCYGLFYTKYSPDLKKEVQKAGSRAARAKYRAKMIAQTPNDADLAAIKEFYRNCPQGYEVDHIIPISKGGLHTLSNLQYLTIRENRSKGSKLCWPNSSC